MQIVIASINNKQYREIKNNIIYFTKYITNQKYSSFPLNYPYEDKNGYSRNVKNHLLFL